jgi:hypothetical protein
MFNASPCAAVLQLRFIARFVMSTFIVASVSSFQALYESRNKTSPVQQCVAAQYASHHAVPQPLFFAVDLNEINAMPHLARWIGCHNRANAERNADENAANAKRDELQNRKPARNIQNIFCMSWAGTQPLKALPWR